jgi:ferredoxin-NADP reductase
MTEIDPEPRMMPSTEEHHEIRNRETTVTPVRGLKKRRRVRNLATEHRQKKQERTWETCGSRKFATACRGIARCAGVARCRGHNGKWYGQDSAGEETQKRRTGRMRRCVDLGCNNAIRDRGRKQQLCGSRRIEDLCGKLPLHFGNKKATNGSTGRPPGWRYWSEL